MSQDMLASFVERIERLEQEKKSISDDVRDVYEEAKSNGFDVKALRAIIKMRKMDDAERRTQAETIETYMHALGMLATTELGQAAMARKRRELEQEGQRLADGFQSIGDVAAAAVGHT